MKTKITSILFGALLGILSACNLENEIEIEIPDFENGYIIESYMTPGKDFGLLITKTVGYFEIFDFATPNPDLLNDLLVQGAQGYIEVNEQRYPLVNKITLALDSSKIYNYVLDEKIAFQEQDRLDLYLQFPDGEEVHASTLIPENRPVDSVRIDIDVSQDYDARETTFLNSDSTTTEYFRRQLFRIHNGAMEELQDFVFDNSIAKGGKLAFGSGYEFNVGDTLVSRITHINEDYHDFYQSVSGSVNANTSPFGQPGRIQSNIQGSDRVIGIFAGINQSEILRKIE